MRRSLVAGAGGIAAAFIGSLCCVGPVLFAALGVGAGIATTFEPLRPAFGVLMVLFLGVGFWTVYRERAPAAEGYAASAGSSGHGASANAGGVACRVPQRRSRELVMIWSATALALALWTFPTWSSWLF